MLQIEEHLFEDMHHPGEHGHVNPDGVAVRVKLILHLRLSCKIEN